MRKRCCTTWIYLAVLCAACSTKPERTSEERTDAWLNPALLDNTLWPHDDFYGFANGGWLSKAVVPQGRNSWDSFDDLEEKNLIFLHQELVNAIDSNRYSFGSDQRKAAEFFAVGMDSARAEQLDVVPITAELDRITAITTRSDLQNYVASRQLNGENIFFGLNTSPDVADPAKVVLHLIPGTLGLSNPDDYLRTDVRSFQLREKYRDYISRLLTMWDREESTSKKNADRVLAFEVQLARASASVRNSGTKTAVRQLMEEYSSIDWLSYLNTIEVKTDSVIIESPDAMKTSNRIFSSLPLDDLKLYLRWCLLREAAPFLSYRFVKASCDFNSWHANGIEVVEPRWKRVLNYTNRYFSEGLGKIFAKAHLSAEAELKVNDIARNIKLAYASKIKDLSEVPDSVKRMWLSRLGAIKIKVRDVQATKRYAGLVVELGPQGSFFENAMRARQFELRQVLARLGKPTDPAQWDAPTQTVRVAYNEMSNELVIPVGILQLPFFDERYDEAANYGGFGALIAGEIFYVMQKADGKVSVWTLKAHGVVPDLTSVSIAFDGLNRHFIEDREPDSVSGMTPRQRFFLSWATSCREKVRGNAVKPQVDKDMANKKSRVNAALSSFDKFYEAFDVKQGNGMYMEPRERTKIW